jgi:hypothetical protein
VDAAGFRECLHVIGWTQRGFANLVKADSRQVRRWAAGDAVIPEHIFGVAREGGAVPWGKSAASLPAAIQGLQSQISVPVMNSAGNSGQHKPQRSYFEHSFDSSCSSIEMVKIRPCRLIRFARRYRPVLSHRLHAATNNLVLAATSARMKLPLDLALQTPRWAVW